MRELWARNIVILTGVLVVLLAMLFARFQNTAGTPAIPAKGVSEQMAPDAEKQALFAAGRRVFESQGCMGCHAIAGEGNPRYPLDGVGQRRSAEAIRQWIIAPPELAGQLPERVFQVKQVYRNLGAEDIDALVTYLQNLR